MDKQNENSEAKIEFDHSNEVTLYSDIAEINVANDSVTLSFALRDRNGKKAKVSHTVYLSIPHFIALADVCFNLKNNMVSDLQQKAEQLRNKKK